MVFVLIHCFLHPNEGVVSGGSKRETADTKKSTFEFELINNTSMSGNCIKTGFFQPKPLIFKIRKRCKHPFLTYSGP